MATLGLLAGTSVLLALIAWRARAFFAVLEAVDPRGEAPSPAGLVSIVIPARNEAGNIERCLRSVFSQDYPALEVIVVDDGSTDDTPRILAELRAIEPRLTVLRGAPLPHGWTGKNFAIAQGVSVARGDWLLFLDADTWLQPAAVRATVAHAAERGIGLLSLVLHEQLVGFWERVLEPIVILVVALMLPMRAMADPERPGVAYAYGPFMLVRRDAYEKAGGHEAQREQVLEDSALARAVKAAGFPVQLCDARALASVRMYEDLAEIWRGWTKNSFLSAGRRVRNVVLLVAGVSVIAFVPPVLLAAAVVQLLTTGYLEAGVLLTTGIAALQAVFLLYLGWRCHRELDVPGRYVLFLPLGAAMFDALLCYSTYRIVRGAGVDWKGRTYCP